MGASKPSTPPPRLYAIVAQDAPVALIFRRGPSRWFHLMRWELESGRLEHGVWVNAQLFPRRCDFSPDGEWVLYFVRGSLGDETNSASAGVARAPWLHPVVEWDEMTSYGRGWHFVTRATGHVSGREEVVQSKVGPIMIHPKGMGMFANEQHRGWIEAPDCPTRHKDDVWDEERNLILYKPCATNECGLRLSRGTRVEARAIEGYAPKFEIELSNRDRVAMPDVAWADWDHSGRLLVATHDGRLQIRDALRGLAICAEHDVRNLEPRTEPTPGWALNNLGRPKE